MPWPRRSPSCAKVKPSRFPTDCGHFHLGKVIFMKRSQSIRINMVFVFGLTLAVLGSASTVANADDPTSPANPGKEARPAVAGALEESWPDRPEWVDMLADILQGSQLGPND